MSRAVVDTGPMGGQQSFSGSGRGAERTTVRNIKLRCDPLPANLNFTLSLVFLSHIKFPGNLILISSGH